MLKTVGPVQPTTVAPSPTDGCDFDEGASNVYYFYNVGKGRNLKAVMYMTSTSDGKYTIQLDQSDTVVTVTNQPGDGGFTGDGQRAYFIANNGGDNQKFSVSFSTAAV